jgi:peptidylprolyl isomerase
MAQATKGDKVKVHYTGKLDDGTEFDSSRGRDPLEFTVGAGQMIPGFEAGVAGMDVGETKSVKITSDQAYGPRHDEMIVTVDRGEFPADVAPAIGDQFQMRHETGQVITVTVTGVEDDKVILDANHPLAGEDLNFDIELVEIA